MKYLYLIILLISISACEKTLDDAVIPYVEQLVIFSMVEAGSYDLEVNISKTLPVLGSSTEEDSYIHDVKAYITDGTNRWDLVYLFQNKYRATGFEGVAGKTYTIVAEWKGKKATAQTTIPPSDVINISSYYLIANNRDWVTYYLMGHCEGSSDYVYQTGQVNYDYYYSNRYFTLPRGKSVVQIDDFWGYVGDETYYLKVQITDIAYFDFLDNSNNGNDFDFFSIGGLNVDWNVQGDGIGMFVGRNYWQDTIHLGDLQVVNN